MTTSAMSWFYNAPENRPYYISERVNTSFWDERIGGILLHVTRSEAPFEMDGTHNGAQVTMEWQPAQWLRLQTEPSSPATMVGLANILRRKPVMRYETPNGGTVWEWRIEDADKRWQEIQGLAGYGRPERL